MPRATIRRPINSLIEILFDPYEVTISELNLHFHTALSLLKSIFRNLKPAKKP